MTSVKRLTEKMSLAAKENGYYTTRGAVSVQFIFIHVIDWNVQQASSSTFHKQKEKRCAFMRLHYLPSGNLN